MRGLGTDIIEISRIRRSVERFGKRFLHRVFTQQEIAYCYEKKDPMPHLAVRFAAKEAVAKAFGSGLRGISFLDIEVINNVDGMPTVKIASRIQESAILLSLSHCREYAIAVAWRE